VAAAEFAEYEELGHVVATRVGLDEITIDHERESGQRSVRPNEKRIPTWLGPVAIQVGV
jgi:hypothetical protein